MAASFIIQSPHPSPSYCTACTTAKVPMKLGESCTVSCGPHRAGTATAVCAGLGAGDVSTVSPSYESRGEWNYMRACGGIPNGALQGFGQHASLTGVPQASSRLADTQFTLAFAHLPWLLCCSCTTHELPCEGCGSRLLCVGGPAGQRCCWCVLGRLTQKPSGRWPLRANECLRLTCLLLLLPLAAATWGAQLGTLLGMRCAAACSFATLLVGALVQLHARFPYCWHLCCVVTGHAW